MRNMIGWSIVVVSMCGCNAIPTTSISTTETCRIAGSSQSEINNLRTLIENARDAGALAADVLSDASTSCEVCLDPKVDCDATLCESCFSAIVSEVFAEQK